ncbi:MAG: vitamin B12 dependent-methionine synthase activation domain-containing protein [bacterium]
MINCNTVEILSSLPDITIPRKAVLRRIGYPGDTKKLGKQIETIFNELIKETNKLINPAGSFIVFKINQNSGKRIIFDNSDFIINSPQVGKMLIDSDYVVVFIVTIGPELEEKVSVFLKNNEMTKAFIMDAMGSETADTVADKLHYNLIASKAASDSFKVTPRFSPGYGDWDIKVQSKIADLCRSKIIGVKVNEYSMMIPKKSVSAVFGLQHI